MKLSVESVVVELVVVAEDDVLLFLLVPSEDDAVVLLEDDADEGVTVVDAGGAVVAMPAWLDCSTSTRRPSNEMETVELTRVVPPVVGDVVVVLGLVVVVGLVVVGLVVVAVEEGDVVVDGEVVVDDGEIVVVPASVEVPVSELPTSLILDPLDAEFFLLFLLVFLVEVPSLDPSVEGDATGGFASVEATLACRSNGHVSAAEAVGSCDCVATATAAANKRAKRMVWSGLISSLLLL